MLSEKARNVSPSLTLTIGAKAKQMKSQGIKVCNLAAGEPDFELFDHIKKAGIDAIGMNKYTPTPGLPELRQAICDKLKRENELDYLPEEVIVSNGAKQILFTIFFALGGEGAEFIIPKPYWVSYEEQVKLAGAKAVFCETDKLMIKAKLIEEKITPNTKAVLINSPCNPTGGGAEKEEIKKIVDLCLKHDIMIISDEVYEHFTYDFEQVSAAKFSKDIVITVNAVSKSYSMTGLRIGYCAGPKKIISAMTKIQDHVSSGASSIAQKMAIAALNGPQDEIKKIRDRYEKRKDMVVKELNSMGLDCVSPKGTFYCFPSIKKTGMKSLEFCEKLLVEKHVACVPGIAFGDDDHIRLSFVGEEEDIISGLKRLREFVNT